jgi:putative ABC transport system permease protein
MKYLALFLTHSWRYYRKHKVLAVINVAGITLGVTVFLAIQIVNQSALNAFKASVDLVAGKANLSIEAEGVRFPEEAYAMVKQRKEILAATPVVEEFSILPDYPGQYLHILGVDPFSAQALNVYEVQQDGSQAAISFFTDPDSLALTVVMAKKLGLNKGDRIRLQTTRGPIWLRISGLLAFTKDTPGGSPELAVMDIANVQDRFGLGGKLSRVDCLVDPDLLRNPTAFTAFKKELDQQLPGNIRLAEPGRRGARVDKMTEAFQLNLTALSLVALVVGMFLIYNTMSSTVVRRRMEIGLLRAIGLQAREVQFLFLGEALLFGLAGMLLGWIFSVLLAQALIASVSQTLTSLYMLVRIHDLVITPVSLLASALAAIVSVLAAAWFPSLEATRVRPIEALSMGTLALKARHQTGIWAWAAILLLVFSFLSGWLSLVSGWKWISFGSALFALLGMAFFVPLLSQWISLRRCPGSVLGLMALRNFGRSLHRNSVTAAALVTAVSMVLGISIMIHSFRETVDDWIKRTIQADLYLAPASNLMIGAGERLPRGLVEKIETLPEVRAVNRYREIRIHLGEQPVKLAAAQIEMVRRYHRFRLIDGSDKGLERDTDPQNVIVSEPFARQHGKVCGDFFTLKTPSGEKKMMITGIYEDFSTDRGMIFMEWEIFKNLWHEDEVNSLALYLKEGADQVQVQEEISREALKYGPYLLYSNRKIREEAMGIFDQTFAVTQLLRFIALIVAGGGIFMNVSILTSERQREIGVLRANGATRMQVIKILLTEACLLGLVSAILGTIGGFVLALLLSYVINISFFGWTIQWSTPWMSVLLTPISVVMAAVLAACYPAWQASRMEIALAVREE